MTNYFQTGKEEISKKRGGGTVIIDYARGEGGNLNMPLRERARPRPRVENKVVINR